MVSAYIMIKMQAGKDETVIDEIKRLGKMGQVREANATYGAYDLVMRVEFKNIEELDRFIFEAVRRIPGVVETVSMISAKTIV